MPRTYQQEDKDDRGRRQEQPSRRMVWDSELQQHVRAYACHRCEDTRNIWPPSRAELAIAEERGEALPTLRGTVPCPKCGEEQFDREPEESRGATLDLLAWRYEFAQRVRAEVLAYPEGVVAWRKAKWTAAKAKYPLLQPMPAALPPEEEAR